jgi:hypothetical protein
LKRRYLKLLISILFITGCRPTPIGSSSASSPVVSRSDNFPSSSAAALVFTTAISDIAGMTKFPILLPSKLPAELGEIKLSRGEIRGEGYYVSLYFEDGIGDAGYAGGFDASKAGNNEIPNTQPVKLADGTAGAFRPVSCGGSCAPANLWWTKGEVTYGIQFKLNSKMDEGRQKRILLEAANASVLVR